MSWKEQLAKAYTTVPINFKELAWRVSLLSVAVSSSLMGLSIWRNPAMVFGRPVEQQSIIQRFAGNKRLRQEVYALMEEYFFATRPHGLMLVSWEELNNLVGVWVRPADEFPGKAGAHSLSADMRDLGGPFLFGECSHTDSIAMPGMAMVACPINSEYDSWGYVAAIVDPSDIERTQRLLEFLSHRITVLIY